MEVKDIFGSGEAINKLIETVEKAVGWFCASIKKKRDTKGSVEEIRCICDVVRDNIDIPIKYEKNGITIDTANMQEVLVRSTQRQMYQEYIKEINIEAIVEKTADKLQSIQAVSDSPVNTAWANSFFDSAGYIDDPELQDFWAKMLASEVIEPGCISKRTLEVVKQLSIEEVKLFDKVVQYVLYFEDCTNSVIDYIIPRDERILSHINISTPDLITLEEAGLVANSANIEERFILNKSEIKNRLFVKNSG